jgi:hypothetical protein
MITAVNGRIYGGKAPQAPVHPFVLFYIINAVPINKLSEKANLDHTHVQFDCWGKRYEDAQSVARTLRLVLDGFVGPMGSLQVRVCRCIDPGTDDFDYITEDFRVIAEYHFWHTI